MVYSRWDWDKDLIQFENNGEAKILAVTLLDDHKKHINGHLKHIWKPRILLHLMRHVYMYFRKKKVLGGQDVTHTDIMHFYLQTPKGQKTFHDAIVEASKPRDTK